MAQIPSDLWLPQTAFAADYYAAAKRGLKVLQQSRIGFVGLARNCASALQTNLECVEVLAKHCKSWMLHIDSNDCIDQTPDVLEEFCATRPQASYRYQVLGREHYGGEFAGRRTIALAEYRAACQRSVSAHGQCDYVIAIDWDAWGGPNLDGVLHGLGLLSAMPEAFGMASVSLAEHHVLTMDGSGSDPKLRPAWIHYDAWALRGVGQPTCYWDDYGVGQGGWKHQWLPPVGSQPVVVASAFGGLAIYRTADYLAGTYDGKQDCEHVTFHRSIAEATGRQMYVCPGMRMVMQWMEEDPNAGDGVDGVQDVSKAAS